MNIVILAAGQGKRLGLLSPDSLPKVLHSVAGAPMLAHVINAVRAATMDGVANTSVNIVIVVGFGAEKVQEAG